MVLMNSGSPGFNYAPNVCRDCSTAPRLLAFIGTYHHGRSPSPNRLRVKGQAGNAIQAHCGGNWGSGFHFFAFFTA